MTDRRRLAAWLLTGLMLFVILTSGFEIAWETHHVCAGADCRICAHITVMRELLRDVSLAVVLAAAAAESRFVQTAVQKGKRRFAARSPVCLRVKLLN